MTIIMRDLMQGNPKLKEMGFKEEALGHNAIAAGFQGQRQWTDFYPNGDYSEALLNTSFDWNGLREAYVVATENDACNGVAMLFGHLLTNRAQIFSDVRTYWSPEAVKRVTGKELTGMAANGIIHLINSGATTLDGTGQQQDANGNPTMKPYWEISEEEMNKCLEATTWYPANRDYFRRRVLIQLPVKRWHACYHEPTESGERTRSCAADRRRMDSRNRSGNPQAA